MRLAISAPNPGPERILLAEAIRQMNVTIVICQPFVLSQGKRLDLRRNPIGVVVGL
jgi:hypothetical protein